MLRLYHPISGIEMEWHAPIPQDMVELIEVMRADFEEHKDEVDSDEARVSRFWRDVRCERIGGGTDEIMIYVAGRQILKDYQNK